MTIICAHVDQIRQVTWLGSDTQAHNGEIRETCGGKWTCYAGWAVGSSGDLRAINLARRHIHEIVASQDPYDIAAALRGVLEDDGYERTDKGGAVGFGQYFMIATAGRLWSVGIDFSLLEIEDFYADGCGRELGFGAWHALHTQRLSGGEQIVRAALAAACAYHVNCGGRPWVDVLREDNVAVASAVLAAA